MKRYIVLLLLICGCSIANNYGANLENDVVIPNKDEDYSHGTTFYHSTDAQKPTWVSRNITEKLPLFSENSKTTRYTSIISQEMHHPEDLRETEIIEDDVPYAGFLYGKLKRISATENKRIESSLLLGLVGPHTYAGEVQTFVHRDLGLGATPMGWDNQLSDEPIINLGHQRSFRRLLSTRFDNVNTLQARIGNAYTDAWFHNETRFWAIGKPIGLDINAITAGFHAYLFGSAGSGLIARDIFYDGNTFEDSHSVSKLPIVGRTKFGIATGYDGYWLKFSLNTSTKRFKEQDSFFHTYGSLNFGIDW